MVNLKQFESEDAKSYGDRALLLEEKLELVSEELLAQSDIQNKDIAPTKYLYSQVIIEFFINGLKFSDVKNIVKSNNIKELVKATEYAHSLESSFMSNQALNKQRNLNRNFAQSRNQENFSSFKVFNNPNPRNNYGNSSNNRNFHSSGQFDRNGQRQIKREIKTEPINNINARRIKCNFCGKIGHTEQHCYSKNKPQINVIESKNETEQQQKGPDIEELQMMRSLRIS